jgi:hypothetical protein
MRSLAAATIFALALPLSPVSAQPATVGDLVKQMLIEPSEATGLSVDELLDLPLEGAARYGSLRAVITEVGDVRVDRGPGETPEIAVGNFLHIYVNLADSGPCVLRRVTSSLPSDQLPKLEPPSPVVSEGRLEHVSGTYSSGIHLIGVVGGPYGTGISTDPELGSPVYTRTDLGIDHVGMWESDESEFYLFGACIAVGVSFALGVAQFQPGSIAGEQIPFPDIP